MNNANSDTRIADDTFTDQGSRDLSLDQQLALAQKLNKAYEAIIDLASVGIWVTDGKGKTTIANQAACRTKGITKEQVIGKSVFQLVKEGVICDSATIEVINRKCPASILTNVPNGRRIMVESVPILDETGNISNVVTNCIDVTELNYLKEQLEHHIRMNSRYQNVIEDLQIQNGSYNIVSRSQQMKNILELALRVAQTDSTVLLTGKSGVGKEVIARLLHYTSNRKKQPFIKINCSAIPEALFESELFGYEGGSFTGAKKEGKIGLAEMANEGTLFLDEIGEMPLSLQPKILEFLQDQTFLRVGGNKSIQVNVRVIAATNRDLENQIEEKQFREDLYYRLNVIPIRIPPLRERKEDIYFLSMQFLKKFNAKYSKSHFLNQDSIDILENYEWPGNVRELENLIERLVLITEEEVIRPKHMPAQLTGGKGCACNVSVNGLMRVEEAVEEVERQLYDKAYKQYQNTYQVAEVLGVSQPTVVRKLQKYGATKKLTKVVNIRK
ncbi:MAG: sigma 54-interacting transcriptional regulator [Syntrophomonas sp.]|nr:sigma 54-interacting transcriptional regulator [Syntrophomonas sp.]